MKLSYGALIAAALLLNPVAPYSTWAWGDEGHEGVTLIAQAHLNPASCQEAIVLLAVDTDPLTAHDVVVEATASDTAVPLTADEGP